MQLNHPIEFMRLTLVYSGPLHSQSSSDTRNHEKHAIRCQFHKQVRDLWLTHPALEGVYDRWSKLSESEKADLSNSLITHFDIGNYRFIPLVTKRLWLACELDILFLRREPAGYIIDDVSGDIDNRIKVLLDALRKPRTPNEIPSSTQPNADETPYFCLLEDDSLVTRLAVETDRLLEPTTGSESDVKLILRVKVKVVKLSWATIGLGGD